MSDIDKTQIMNDEYSSFESQKTMGFENESRKTVKVTAKIHKGILILSILFFITAGGLAFVGYTNIAEHEGILNTADNYVDDKEFEKAFEKYNEALKLQPANESTKEKIIEASEKMQEFEIEKAIKAGDKLVEKKNYREALTAYNKGLAYDNKNAKLLSKVKKAETELNKEWYATAMEKGNEEITNKKYSDAIAYFNEALIYAPADVNATSAIEKATLLQKQTLQDNNYYAIYSGSWAVKYDWGCAGSGSWADFYLNKNGTFTTSEGGNGTWIVTATDITIKFSSVTYKGKISGKNSFVNGKITGSSEGCWRGKRNN